MSITFATLLYSLMQLISSCISKPTCWYDNEHANAIITEAVSNGWVYRPSTTQVEWTAAGVKAYEEAVQ